MLVLRELGDCLICGSCNATGYNPLGDDDDDDDGGDDDDEKWDTEESRPEEYRERKRTSDPDEE